MPPSTPGAGLSRRRFIALAGAVPLLASCSAEDVGTRVTGRLTSRATGEDHDWAVRYPPGSATDARLPVVIVLHGRGDSIDTVEKLEYPARLAELVRGGVAPFALAAIDGGELYWQRTGNRDAGKLVADEFVSLLAARGLDTARLGLTGWSMGGWGTLRLASRELRGRLRVAAALSAPCVERFADIADPGSMTREEFDANNYVPHPDRFAGLPLLLACGRSDPFFAGNAAFAEVLRATSGVNTLSTLFADGGHSQDFWRSVAGQQLSFLAHRV